MCNTVNSLSQAHLDCLFDYLASFTEMSYLLVKRFKWQSGCKSSCMSSFLFSSSGKGN